MELVEDRGLLWYVDRNDRSRGFCGTCGSGIFWSRDGDPEIYVYAGSLDEPTGLRTGGHMMVDSRADWEDLTGVAPMYAENLGERLVDPADIVRA